MAEGTAALVQLLAIVGIVVGLAGLVLPVIPGPAVIWISCVAWAWADGFDRVGWPALAFITVLAIIAQGADLILGAFGVKRSGVAVSTLVLSAVAAVVGFLLLQFVGAVVAAAVTLVLVETRRLGGDWRTALRSGGIFVVAYVSAMALEIVLSVLMVVFFAVQVITG
jgi:uncharacterized protein YqgC (DUF456 family)